MKSAFELALERSGGTLKEIDSGMKEKLAEIDNIRKAKLAGMEIAYEAKLKKAASTQEVEQIKDDMAVERASILSKTERDKQAARKQ
ncbi:MAG: hypothetical protein WC071_03765 [Victivallaceae bacterium]